MIDIELIRNSFDATAANLSRRGFDAIQLAKLKKMDEAWREQTAAVENLRSRQNIAGRQFGSDSPEKRQATIADMKKITDQRKKMEKKLLSLAKKRELAWQNIPNLISADVPTGPDSASNVTLRTIGNIPKFSFKPKEHWELGANLGIIDTVSAGQITGSRFTYLKGQLASLQFALIQLALSVVTSQDKLAAIAKQADLDVSTKPFTPVIPPVMIRPEVMQKMARLEPKEERYYIPSDDLFLVGSAEHTLGPLHMNKTIAESDLPIRYVGYSTSFRREAGSYGKDVRGILRMHQFDKLEIESFTLPETSLLEQNFIVTIQEHLLQLLKLPYRVVLIAAGDMGAPDARQIDQEVWLPGQNQYRETHTSDLMTDYQARRLNTKIKRTDGQSAFAHMNDATVFAIGRTLIAIMENYQQTDGSITIPDALHPYLPFTKIQAEKNP